MTIAPPPPTRTGSGALLNGAGALVVAYWASRMLYGSEPSSLVFSGISLLALFAWVVRVFSRRLLVRDVCAVVMVVAGSAMIVPTDALLITPALVAVAGVTSEVRHRVVLGPAFAVVGALITVVSALAADRPVSFLAGTLAGFALAVAVGVNRRQAALAAVRDRADAAREVELDRQQQRAELLAERATVARDIHDVLAHSLGGLVIQLDAVEALLENGRIAEATRRVGAARTLAAEGLGEARRAVATLRDPEAQSGEGPDPLASSEAVSRLMAAHRELGGTVTVTGEELLDDLDDRHRRVLGGVLREALSNMRRHAPGREAHVTVSRVAGPRILVSIANGVDRASAGAQATGTGQGLPGMTSRVAELADASTLTAGPQGDQFVVLVQLETVTAPTARQEPPR